MLTEKELFPEFLTDRCEAKAIAGQIIGWLNEPKKYQALSDELKDLRARVAEPGACERAARFILSQIDKEMPSELSSHWKASA